MCHPDALVEGSLMRHDDQGLETADEVGMKAVPGSAAWIFSQSAPARGDDSVFNSWANRTPCIPCLAFTAVITTEMKHTFCKIVAAAGSAPTKTCN
jgi:hypothetical protein